MAAQWMEAAVAPTATPSAAPMHVMRVRDAIKLSHLPTHEEAASDGLLVEWQDGMNKVIFVSQTWLRFSHPDDTAGSKARLLSSLLQHAVDGILRITPNPISEMFWGDELAMPATQR